MTELNALWISFLVVLATFLFVSMVLALRDKRRPLKPVYLAVLLAVCALYSARAGATPGKWFTAVLALSAVGIIAVLLRRKHLKQKT